MPSGFDTSRVVAITVGEGNDQKTFTIHEDLLTRESEYFHTALNSAFIEEQSKKVNLPEDDVDAFELFAHHIYCEHFPDYLFQSRAVDAESRAKLIDLWVRAYQLADKLMAVVFRDSLDNEFIGEFGGQITMHELLDVAKTIYAMPVRSARGMRNMLASMCSRMLHSTWTLQDRQALVESGLTEFVVDVLGRVS